MAVLEPQFDLAGQGHRTFYGTAPPTASDVVGLILNVGDFIRNVNPNLGGVIGWICSAAGNPGTWVELEGNSGASFTFTAAQVNAMYTTPLVLVPAQGVGTFIEPISIFLENVYGAVFTGGGAIGGYYLNNAGSLATSTVAATFLTTPTVNQVALLTGAVGSDAASTAINQPLVLSNATAVFAGGAGSSLIVKVKYRFHLNL
jgi:hypothetical protein